MSVPPVKMIPVKSSNLAEVGFRIENDLARTGTLFIRFHPKKGETTGALWGYSPVPEHVHTALMTAPSHGSYFDTHIKRRSGSDASATYKAKRWE